MNKKCTNSSCRKTFSTLYFAGNCPYCGKKYPQLVSQAKPGNLWAVRILDYNGQKVKAIKLVRQCYQIGLKEAKMVIDQVPDPVFILKHGMARQFMEGLSAFGGTAIHLSRGSKKRSNTILMPPQV